MKVYKFRGLTTGGKDDENVNSEFNRLKDVLEKGFYCPRFCEMNDAMEGVFDCYGKEDEIIKKVNDIFSEKIKYRICSFSGANGFKNPLLWGYYAGGFKGVAIEVDVHIENDTNRGKNIFKQIEYEKNSPEIFTFKSIKYKDAEDIKNIAQKILVTKLDAWKHEDEFRFLVESSESGEKEYEIGKITAIYFGNPYLGLDNGESFADNECLSKYLERKKMIISIAKDKDIKCFNVKIENGEVVKGEEL